MVADGKRRALTAPHGPGPTRFFGPPSTGRTNAGQGRRPSRRAALPGSHPVKGEDIHA